MLPPASDRPKLAAVLGQLSAAVEELLLAGLTTASDATRQTLSTAMQEAARYRLLRLGSSLRTAAEELGRFKTQDASFSRKRLTFFLGRSWLLSRGLSHALETGNEAEYDRLTWSSTAQPLKKVEVVCLGAAKRVAAGAFVAFEFRFRVLSGSAPVQAGQSLSWSCVFPVKPGMEVPPEGFLHLPQKQKFAPFLFLDGKSVVIERASVVVEKSGGRLSLTDESTVVLGKAFDKWDQFLDWSPEPAIERLRQHVPSPLELDTELQEEVVLRDYKIEEPEEGDAPGQTVYPIIAGPLRMSAVVGLPAEGKTLRKNLDELRKLKKNRPPLLGLLHYERCRLVLQVLSAFRPEPDYLTISPENINKAALLKAMSFT
jgi:hypothetical protein